MTEAQIREAREMWAQGVMRKIIAKRLGVSGHTITRVCHDLPKPIEFRGIKIRKRRKFAGKSIHQEDYDAA